MANNFDFDFEEGYASDEEYYASDYYEYDPMDDADERQMYLECLFNPKGSFSTDANAFIKYDYDWRDLIEKVNSYANQAFITHEITTTNLVWEHWHNYVKVCTWIRTPPPPPKATTTLSEAQKQKMVEWAEWEADTETRWAKWREPKKEDSDEESDEESEESDDEESEESEESDDEESEESDDEESEED
jgi:hypothetical protein